MQTIKENYRKTNINVEADKVYEIDCETDSRASIQFTKPSNLNYHSYYKWCSDCESAVNVIRDNSIKLIPKFIEITNQIEISSKQYMIKFEIRKWINNLILFNPKHIHNHNNRQ